MSDKSDDSDKKKGFSLTPVACHVSLANVRDSHIIKKRKQ